MKDPHPRRPLVRQIGGVLVWGLGVSTASIGAVLVVLAVTHRLLGLGGASGGFPWMGALGLALAVPFVAFILGVWARIAFGHRPGAAR